MARLTNVWIEKQIVVKNVITTEARQGGPSAGWLSLSMAELDCIIHECTPLKELLSA